MKICLFRSRPDSGMKFSYPFDCDPPIFLGYLGQALKPLKLAGYDDLSFVDARLLDLNPRQAADRVLDENPDIIIIQTHIGFHHGIREFIRIINRHDIPVLCVGLFVTYFKEIGLDFLGAEFGIVGEFEESTVKVVKDFGSYNPTPDIDGFIFKYNGKWIYSNDNHHAFIKDINTLPMQNWKLLNPPDYNKLMQAATLPLKHKNQAALLVTRGCPYKCTFCFCESPLFNKKLRHRTPESIIAEIQYLKKEFDIGEIIFTDDALNFNEKWFNELLDLMIESKLNIYWRSPKGLRADKLNDKIVKKMAASGCYYIGIGIESGNQGVVNRMNKKLDLTSIPKTIELLHKYNIKVSGFFMLGSPGETIEEIKDSIRFSMKLKLDRMQASVFCPYPGSEDFERIFTGEYRDTKIDWYLKYEDIPQYINIPLKKLYSIQFWWMLRFYMQPRILFSMIYNFRISQIKAIFKHPWVLNWIGRKRNEPF